MNAEKNAIKYVIEANKLTKYYGKSKGIEDLDLAVEQGDFFGFIGLIISCPVTSVVYTLTRRFVFTRLRKKKIPHSKFDIIIDKPKPRLHKAKKGGGMMGKLSGIFKSGKPVDFSKLKIKVKQKKH